MRYEKDVIAEMPKAYAVAPFEGADGPSLVVATEKEGPIRRFSLDGAPMETVAEGPGGVMTLLQTPGRDDQLLATSRFFSPNFGADDAAIVSYTRRSDGTWSAFKLCDLPYVHRFGVLRAADGRFHLIACTIKGSCGKVKDDWRRPGAVWAAPLPPAVEEPGSGGFNLRLIAAQQLQNHGFWTSPDRSFALVSTAAGVFRYTPPARPGADWDVVCLVVAPTSDVCMADLDGDGKDELVTISAFHGDVLSVFHEGDEPDRFELVWRDPRRRPFLHAIWSGEIAGEPSAVVGARGGDRALVRLSCRDGSYASETIDEGRGAANCLVVSDPAGVERIVAANRETDEVALYEILPGANPASPEEVAHVRDR